MVEDINVIKDVETPTAIPTLDPFDNREVLLMLLELPPRGS